MSKTRELQRLWWDWLGTSERLLNVLGEQTQALIKRDVAAVEQLQPQLDTMLGRIAEIDQKATDTAKRLAEEMEVEPNLRSLTKVLSDAEGQSVNALANRVRSAAVNIETQISKNSKLIDNELNFVQGTLSLYAKLAQNQEAKYGASKPETAAVLMNQVA